MNYKNTTERHAVKIFLDFYNIKYSDADLRNSEESDSVDIYFDKEEKEFQVTSVEGDVVRLLREKEYSLGTNANEAIYKFIIRPLQKKIERYKGGTAINSTTLLIHTINIPLEDWLKTGDTELSMRLDHLYKSSGFKDIYLVIDNSNKIIPFFRSG